MQLPRIDQNSEQGQKLQKVVQTQLKDYLGADYADDVLPLYIVVMLAHGNNQDLVAENLDAFLGGNDAKDFSKWLFTHLAEHGSEYAAPEPELEPAADEPGAHEEDLQQESPDQEDGPPRAVPDRTSPKDDRADWHRKKIEWPGEAAHQRSERPRDDKRRREESDRPERHAVHREREGEDGRDDKRQRRDMRDLRPLESSREERRRDRERDRDRDRDRGRERDRERRRPDDGRHHHDEREHHDRERQQRREAAPQRPMGRTYMDRELELRDRERSHDRDLRSRMRDRDQDMLRPPRHRHHDEDADAPLRAEQEYIPSDIPRRGEGFDEPVHRGNGRQNGVRYRVEPEADLLPRRQPPRAQEDDAGLAAAADGPSSRANVFERLGRGREKVYLTPEAARKSVFDRLRGNRQEPKPKEDVDPEAPTDEDEPEEASPERPSTKMALTKKTQSAVAPALTGLPASASQAKSEDLLEMKRKMLELQEQVKRLEREHGAGAPSLAAAGPLPVISIAPSVPAVDPCSVHVQGVSHLAVPDVIAAHFSGCGRVMNVTIARDLNGWPRGFAHVEFSNELEAKNALSLSGSILLQQQITVTPKINMPAAALLPGGGRGFGRGSPFPVPGRSGGRRFGRSSPFPGSPYPGRGRGRATSAASHKYIRPELQAELQRQKSGTDGSNAQANVSGSAAVAPS